MTLTLTKKMFLLGVVSILMFTTVSAEYSYSNSNDYGLDDQTEFSIPEYDSQQEILTKLVVPFLFLTVLLRTLFNRALRFAFVDDSGRNDLLTLVEDNKPNLNREATLMAITATGMLVPTPFWTYVTYAVGSIAVLSLTALIAVLLFFIYLVWKF